MHYRQGLQIFFLCSLGLISTGALPARIEVPSGVMLSINGASLAAGVYDLVVDGTLDITSGDISVLNVTIGSMGRINGGGGTIEVAGDWNNTGTFNPGSGTVVFGDGGSLVGVLSGSTRFYNLAFLSNNGKTFRLSPDDDVEVLNDLRIVGKSDSPVVMEASPPGRLVSIRVGGRVIDQYVFWKEVSIIRNADTTPIPALNPATLVFLAILIASLGFRFLHFQKHNTFSRISNV